MLLLDVSMDVQYSTRPRSLIHLYRLSVFLVFLLAKGICPKHLWPGPTANCEGQIVCLAARGELNLRVVGSRRRVQPSHTLHSPARDGVSERALAQLLFFAGASCVYSIGSICIATHASKVTLSDQLR